MKNSLFKLTKIAALGLMLSSGVAFANINETYNTMSIQEVTKLSNQGDFRALAELGNRYYLGRDVAKDKQKAYALFQKAAKMNSTRAQNYIGTIHMDNKEYLKAKEWFEKAINNPNKDDIPRKALAYESLARLYGDGKGVAKDLKKAFEFAAQSVQLHTTPSGALYLGWVYEQYKDYKQAKIWYEEATKSTIDDKYKKAVAYANLGGLYGNGRGVKKDLDNALEFFLKSENLSPSIRAELDIAWAYREKEEYKNAVEWYLKAINNPSQDDNRNKSKANYQLANLYRVGKGVPFDMNKALELNLQAEQLSPHNDFKKAIAEIYEWKENPEKAAEWRAKIK